jgi:hypothetical protein
MGTFSYVTIDEKVLCPNCNAEVSGFQSKDLDTFFETVNYWEGDNFYTSCDICDAWIEFNKIKEINKSPLKDYEIKVFPSEVTEEQLMKNDEGKIIGYQG